MTATPLLCYEKCLETDSWQMWVIHSTDSFVKDFMVSERPTRSQKGRGGRRQQ